jgi:hypothetical protein
MARTRGVDDAATRSLLMLIDPAAFAPARDRGRARGATSSRCYGAE